MFTRRGWRDDLRDVTDDSQYDDPEYYFESWDEWGDAGRAWARRTIHHPTNADIAEALLYQAMRGGIWRAGSSLRVFTAPKTARPQKTVNEMAKKDGRRPARIVTPKQFLEELERDDLEIRRVIFNRSRVRRMRRLTACHNLSVS